MKKKEKHVLTLRILEVRILEEREVYVTNEFLITTDELASRLNISRRTLYRMIKESEVPKHRVGGQWRFSWLEVQQFIKSGPTSRNPDFNNIGSCQSHP